MTFEKVNFTFNANYFTNGINTGFSPNFSWESAPIFSNFNLTDMPCLSNNDIFQSFDFSKIELPRIDFPNTFSNSFWNSSTSMTFTTPSFKASSNVDTFEKKSNKFSLEDYNSQKGEKLAKIALVKSSGFGGYCARAVKKAISESGLGEYKSGHAYQMRDILKDNKNFKEISPSSVDVKELPAGCVLVFNKGVHGYSSEYGHTEITTGDGRGVSDGITRNLKQPSAIFIPVSA